MNTKESYASRIFGVIATRRTYLNVVYILAAFPLGVFYFVFLISGLSTGISLLIVWIGLPILLIVGTGWRLLARFERALAIYLLNEKVPPMTRQTKRSEDIWTQFKEYLRNPVTWKSLIYLLLKFPLGMATFVILVTVLSITVTFLAMPFIYEILPEFQVGLFFGRGLPNWEIDSLGDALVGTLIGLVLLPVTLQVGNGLAWVHAKFARIMLSVNLLA